MQRTENVAVLFTDLVRSTAIAADLLPDEVDELRRSHFSTLRQAIAAHDGTEVKNLGDGLMVVFDTASAAASCAVAMQQNVERSNRTSALALGLRVGVSMGEATRDGDDYFGDPVIEAARLCAAADGGQILANDLVRMVASRRSPHVFGPVGPLQLKGLPDPVETVEVVWAPLVAAEPETAAVPLPVRLGAGPSTGFIAREAETEALADAVKRVGHGDGCECVLICGEAGMGKSTLAAEAARRAHGTGAVVLFGRCDEDLGIHYGPFVEALHHLVTHSSEAFLRAHVDTHGSELARVVPALRQRLGELPDPQSTDPETERYLLFSATVGLLRDLSADAPVVLVLDDLQWADRPSLQLLRHLIANATTARLLVIGTYRDSELSAAHPLSDTLAALRRERGVSFVALHGLDDGDVLAFVEAAAGHHLDDDGVHLAHALYQETDGNPFFVNEVLRHLSETGAIYQDATGRWVTDRPIEDLALPDSIRQVIGSRVARLGDAARPVLPLAAVIGREFDLELLALVTGQSEDDLLDILDAASSAALVREVPGAPGRYCFAHALIQHTLYQDMGETRRARAHRRVGEALETVCGDEPGRRMAELAHHWFSATHQVDTAKAIVYSRGAGQAALAGLAPEDAVRYFAQALSLAQQSDDRRLENQLRIDLGVAQLQAGMVEHRQTLLDAARVALDGGHTDELVKAALANTRGSESSPGEIDRHRVDVFERALEALPAAPSRERARLLSNLALELTYEPDPARRTDLATEACTLARQLDDPATLLYCLNAWASCLRLPETLPQRLVTTAEALELARDLDDPEREFSACRQRFQAAIESGDRAETDRMVDAMEDIASRIGLPRLVWSNTIDRGMRALLAGEVARAEALVEAALELGTRSGQPDALIIYGIQLLDVRTHQGRTGEVVDFLTEAVAGLPGLPAARAAVARGLVDAGRPDDAAALLDREEMQLPHDELWLAGTATWAFSVARLGRVDDAARLYDQLAPWAGQQPSAGVGITESVDHCLGELAARLGDQAQADRHFADAETLARRLSAPFFVARTLLERARLDLAQAQPGRAADRIAEARALAGRYHYAGIEGDAAGLEAGGG